MPNWRGNDGAGLRSPARRQALHAALLLAAASWVPLTQARQEQLVKLVPTPSQMLGPFYPLQPDPIAGSDLTDAGKAAGAPLQIVGRVIDVSGQPLAGVLVEIWQTNAHGRYHHPHDTSPAPLDPAFRGYGRHLTMADGGYVFRTIAPVSYPGRTPHVHFRLSRGERELLVTQMYLPNQRSNQRDGLFMSTGDAEARQRLVGVAVADREATLRFDIILALAA